MKQVNVPVPVLVPVVPVLRTGSTVLVQSTHVVTCVHLCMYTSSPVPVLVVLALASTSVQQRQNSETNQNYDQN